MPEEPIVLSSYPKPIAGDLKPSYKRKRKHRTDSARLKKFCEDHRLNYSEASDLLLVGHGTVGTWVNSGNMPGYVNLILDAIEMESDIQDVVKPREMPVLYVLQAPDDKIGVIQAVVEGLEGKIIPIKISIK